MKADLHMHSVNSDGILTPAELKDLAKRVGMNVVAITDHDHFTDTTDLNDDDLKFIYGLELSTEINNESIHILGYFKNIPDKEFLDFLEDSRIKRVERANKICDLLEKYFGIVLDRSFINDGKNSITRGQISREIRRQGYSFSDGYVFSVIMGTGCPCYIPSTKLSVKDGLELIKKHKGLAVLAHPMLYKKENLEQIIDLGFDGMEVRYPKTGDVFAKYRDLAVKGGMFITGGSDFHAMQESMSPTSNHGIVGDAGICDHELDIFLKKLEERGK